MFLVVFCELGMTALTSHAQIAVSSEIDRLVADDFELRFANNIGVPVSVRLACTMAQKKKTGSILIEQKVVDDFGAFALHWGKVASESTIYCRSSTVFVALFWRGAAEADRQVILRLIAREACR